MSKSRGHLTVQYNLRWSEDLRDKIAASAKKYNRSMNSDIVARLNESLISPDNIDMKDYDSNILAILNSIDHKLDLIINNK